MHMKCKIAVAQYAAGRFGGLCCSGMMCKNPDVTYMKATVALHGFLLQENNEIQVRLG